MELCGCHLREVGTTNKTHLSDYERAIGEQTRALLKVHTSNYRIVGFTESLPLSDIVALGCRTGLRWWRIWAAVLWWIWSTTASTTSLRCKTASGPGWMW